MLPAHDIAHAVNDKLAVNDTVIITAAPGAGKSTLLPLTIATGGVEGKVLMLEPRRLAARQIAERMAWMLGEKVGETVGYRMRFETRVSSSTRIEVITEGILTRMLISDPSLEGVAAIIFDEFHERSLTCDLALTLARESQQILRPDLRLVIMSATIDSEALCNMLNAPLIHSEGRMFPVQIVYGEDLPWQRPQEALADVARAIIRAHQQHEGDMLVFLPGEAEIQRITDLLGNALGQTQVCPLYGMLPVEAQRRAIQPCEKGVRKVVLATPIAETSLTIEGIRIVIDTGRCRQMVYDAHTALSHLQTVPISMDMAQQRSGRAGRVAPGVCYRLWNRATEVRMATHRTPEILQADLAPMLLDVAAWGETHIESLPWITPPPVAHVARGRSLLSLLGAITSENQITTHGRQLAALPCHPRIAQLLVSAHSRHALALAADIAALLEASSLPLKSSETDIDVYLDELQRHRQQDGPWARIAQAAAHYARMIPLTESAFHEEPTSGDLIAAAYPERIAMKCNDGWHQYRLANGESAVFDNHDSLAAHPWIAIAHINGQSGRIFLAAAVSPERLTRHATVRDNLSWDNKGGCLISRREWRIGQLLLHSRPIAIENWEEVHGVLCEATQKWGTSMLDFNDAVGELQRRVAQVASWHPELSLPDLSTCAVLENAGEWLPFYLGHATKTAELKKIDLTQALWGLLDYDQQQLVDRLAPARLTLPSGRTARVEYRQGAEAPIVRVRLQDCFGMKDTPRVDDGRQAVLMELLSPGFKPVQLTSDLHSFWTSTYYEVRKELKRRYPKHAWPEHPDVGG